MNAKMKYLRMTQSNSLATMARISSPALGVGLQVGTGRSPKRQEQLADEHRGDLNVRQNAIGLEKVHTTLSGRRGQKVSMDFPAGLWIVLTFSSRGNNLGEWGD